MPPNKQGNCDSCHEKSDALIPIWVWDETSCGDMMTEKFYCVDCFTIRVELDDENDEDEPKDGGDEE